MDSRSTRSVVQQVDQDRGVQSTQYGDEEILQADQHDLCQHFGFGSSPPAGTELITDPHNSCGAVSVAERSAPPCSLASGEACLYDQNGNVVWCRKSTGIELTVKTGIVKVRSPDAVTKKVVVDQDDVVPVSDFVTWINAVAAAAGYGSPWDPTGLLPIATVKASSTKLETE